MSVIHSNPSVYCLNPTPGSVLLRRKWFESCCTTPPTSMRGTRTGGRHCTWQQPTTPDGAPRSSYPCSAASTCPTAAGAPLCTTLPSMATERYCKLCLFHPSMKSPMTPGFSFAACSPWNPLTNLDRSSLLTHKLSEPLLSLFFEMVSLLLSKGANNNAFDKKDGRALHWAAFMGECTLIVRL